MYKALYLSPMIPSFDLKKTSHFFKSVLNFSGILESDTYAVLAKDNLTIHLLRAGSDIGQMEFYLEVDDVDSVWLSIRDKVKGLKVREPFDQDYGMREIHIGVPQTNTLLFIGETIK